MHRISSDSNSPDIYETLKCPITLELFQDPVIGSDGHTYERENITAWIRKHGSSPITREPMNISSLRSNFIVKKMVDDFVSSSSQKQYQFRLDVDVCKSKQRPLFQSSNKTIYEAKWMQKYGPSIVLIKIDGAKAKHEASFYVKLSCHPHIVRTYGLVDNNSTVSIMLVQEYAPEGDLSTLLREKHFRPTLDVLLETLRQIVDAMICLADNQIIHGDLACRNVLVFRSSANQSTHMLVKLTDFGLTRASPLFSVIDSSESSAIKMIPIRYAAPEILFDTSPSSYSEKSDVYSFGVLMWEVCSSGTIPFENLKTVEQVHEERIKGRKLEQPNNCSNELWHIIMNCLQQEAEKRPNFKMIGEDLLNLRYQNKRTSVTRISQAESDTYVNVIDRVSSYQNLPEQFSNLTASDTVPIYNNLMNIPSTNQRFSRPIKETQSICEYYIPCEYCLQSINNDDFEAHKNICSVRRIAKSFARSVLQFPLVEITSCKYCENLIPLNMLNIHERTCPQDLIYLKNTRPVAPPQQPPNDNYVSVAYLNPVSLIESQDKDSFSDYASFSQAPVRKSTSTLTIPSVISDPSSTQNESENSKPKRSSRSGIRRAFSNFKKKMSS